MASQRPLLCYANPFRFRLGLQLCHLFSNAYSGFESVIIRTDKEKESEKKRPEADPDKGKEAKTRIEPRSPDGMARSIIIDPRKDLSNIRPLFVNHNEECLQRLGKSRTPLYKALFIDAVGTLIFPSESEAKMYRDIGLKYGVHYSEDEISARFDWAYAKPWDRTQLKYEGDARLFWQYIIEQSTGCKDPAYLEELYQHFATSKAWQLAEPGLEKLFKEVREAGVKIAIVSNFDTRLRPLLLALKCFKWFDAIIVSAEVGAEKPEPEIFRMACDALGIQSSDVVHIGDDKRNDVFGARHAGCDAWLWGEDVNSYTEVARKIGVQVIKK